MDLLYVFDFEAAHSLPKLAADHPCASMHGHRYRVRIDVTGTVDENLGWVMDFADIEEACAPVRASLDHACLNNVEGLGNPTAENVAKWIWSALRPTLLGLSSVEVWENDRMGCVYRGELHG